MNKYLLVDCEPRYWEDSEVNTKEDKKGSLIPCKTGVKWLPLIDLTTGVILNWEQGKKAEIHYKICDQGEYFLLDEKKIKRKKYYSNYVPDILSPNENGFGDYIIMDVDKNGRIKDFDNFIDDTQWLDINTH